MARRRPILKPVTTARRIALSASAGAFGLIGVLIAARGTATSSTSPGAATIDSSGSTPTSSPDQTIFRNNTTTTWSAQVPTTTPRNPASVPQGRTRVS